MKFTPEGKAIDVTVTATDEHTQLSVSDEGMGIEPAFMPQLFQR